MNKLVLIIMSLNINCAWAAPVVLASKSLNNIKFSSKLSLVEGQSYSEYVVEQLQAKSKDFNMLELAIELRSLELNKNHSAIFKLCHKVYSHRHKADWSHEDRNLVRHCISHLALLSTDPRRQASMKLEAEAFRAPDNWERHEIPKLIKDNFDWILINGHATTTNRGFIKLPRTLFRATFVSNRFMHRSVDLTSESFQNFQPQLLALVSGNCQAGFRYEGLSLKSSELKQALVLDRDCERGLTSKHPIALTYKKKNKSNFKVPKWVWWAAAGVVGYGVYKNNQKSSGGSTGGTTKRGF